MLDPAQLRFNQQVSEKLAALEKIVLTKNGVLETQQLKINQFDFDRLADVQALLSLEQKYQTFSQRRMLSMCILWIRFARTIMRMVVLAQGRCKVIRGTVRSV